LTGLRAAGIGSDGRSSAAFTASAGGSKEGRSNTTVASAAGAAGGAGGASSRTTGSSTCFSCKVTAICVGWPKRRERASLIGSRSFDSNADRANLSGAAMMNVPPTARTGWVSRIHACCWRVSADVSASSAVTADQTAARSWSVTFAIPLRES
jgi:hypothetical protein